MKEKIKNAAIELAKEIGLVNLTRRAVCERAGIADGAFTSIMGMGFTDMVGQLSEGEELPVGIPDSRRRVNADIRRKQLLREAVNIAIEKGYDAVTREDVADAAGVSPGLVTYYFVATDMLRDEILHYAIAYRIWVIIAQGFLKKSPIILRHASDRLIKDALAFVAKGV